MTRCLQIETEPNIDAGSLVIGVNRNHPRDWGNNDAPGHRCIDRYMGVVITVIALAVAVFDGSPVALPVPLVVCLLLFISVVMVGVITMGLSLRGKTDTSNGNKKNSGAETLNKRHDQQFCCSDPRRMAFRNCFNFQARCDWMHL